MNAGPLEKVTIPKNFKSSQPTSFGFVVFQHEESVNFAYKLLNGVELHGSKIRLEPHFMTKGFTTTAFPYYMPLLPNYLKEGPSLMEALPSTDLPLPWRPLLLLRSPLGILAVQ